VPASRWLTCARSRKAAIVGTSVRERMKEAIIAKMMASASGRNRYPETPDNWNSGNQTIQMQSVETKVGITIWFAASMMAGCNSAPVAKCVSMFSIITVASSTRMPTARARPPSVMTLMVSPTRERPRIEDRIASGIEVATINVERPEPKNSSTINPVSTAAVTISWTTSSTEARTKVEASFSAVIFTPGGNVRRISGIFAFTPDTIARVDASPAFNTWSSTP
jgi:hypothetical protein